MSNIPIRCKYYDCGWCYHPIENETNSKNGACESPKNCSYLIHLANSSTVIEKDR